MLTSRSNGLILVLLAEYSFRQLKLISQLHLYFKPEIKILKISPQPIEAMSSFNLIPTKLKLLLTSFYIHV